AALADSSRLPGRFGARFNGQFLERIFLFAFEPFAHALLHLWAATGEVDAFPVSYSTAFGIDHCDDFGVAQLSYSVFVDGFLESPLEDLIAGAMLDGGGPGHIAERIRMRIDIKVKLLAHAIRKWLVVCVGDEEVFVGSELRFTFGGELFPEGREFVGP